MFVCESFQQLTMTPTNNPPYGVQRLSPALHHDTETMIANLRDYGYTDEKCEMLRARAHTSQIGSNFSLAREVLKCLPKPEDLKATYQSAGTLGTGIAAVCEEVAIGLRDMPYGPVSTLSIKAKTKVRDFLRAKVLGVKRDRTDDGSINVPDYCEAIGTRNFTAQYGDVASPGVFDPHTGIDAGVNSVDLFTGVERTGRPSDTEHLLRLPDGVVATGIQIAAVLSDLSPSVKQLADEVANVCARVDRGVKIGTNEILPPLLDWATSTGSGTGVVNQPFDLGSELGNKDMSAEQLHKKFATAMQRALFLAIRRMESGTADYTDEDVLELSLSVKMYLRALLHY